MLTSLRHEFEPSVILVVAPALTMPLWLPTLREINDTAGALAPICALLLVLAKLYFTATRRDDARIFVGKAQSTTGEITGALSTAAKVGSKFMFGVAAALGILAVLAYLSTPGRADAAPAPASVASSAARKRASADDAGDDGDVDEWELPDGSPVWLEAARADIGICERTPKGGPSVIVRQWFAVVPELKGSDPRKVPWCAVWVCKVLESVGVPSSKSGMARSYLRWGEALEAPRIGCIVVLWRGSHDDGETGHVGFYVGETRTHIRVLGGNQGDAVSVAEFPRKRVLGYRWPRHSSRIVTAGKVGAGSNGTAVVSTGAAEVIEKTEAVRSPLLELAQYFRWAGIIAGVIGLGCAIYVIWRRYQDRKERGV
jgi:uncharacterized protein (TIGR02594 family)